MDGGVAGEAQGNAQHERIESSQAAVEPRLAQGDTRSRRKRAKRSSTSRTTSLQRRRWMPRVGAAGLGEALLCARRPNEHGAALPSPHAVRRGSPTACQLKRLKARQAAQGMAKCNA